MAPSNVAQCDAGVKNVCKKCKCVPSSGLSCVNCNAVMHPGCIKYMKNVVKIDEKHINCCITESEVDNSDHDGSIADSNATILDPNMMDSIEVKYLKEIIGEKNTVIGGLKDIIVSLKEQIRLLNLVNNLTTVPSSFGDQIAVIPNSLSDDIDKSARDGLVASDNSAETDRLTCE